MLGHVETPGDGDGYKGLEAEKSGWGWRLEVMGVCRVNWRSTDRKKTAQRMETWGHLLVRERRRRLQLENG